MPRKKKQVGPLGKLKQKKPIKLIIGTKWWRRKPVIFGLAFALVAVVVIGITMGGAAPANIKYNASGFAPHIRHCESGNNYRAQNRSSSASGAYQFVDRTWRSIPTSVRGNASRAKDASPAQQDAAFRHHWSNTGSRAWNASYRCWYPRAERAGLIGRTTPSPSPSSSSSSSCGVSQPTVRRGSSGNAVRELQRRLGGLTVDGQFGPATESKVKSYQRSKGLTADGIVGPRTWCKLYGR